MEITILTSDEQIITLNVNPSITVEDLKSLLEVETRATLLFDGKEMVKNSRRLSKYGVGDGDFVVVNNVSPFRDDMIRNSMRLSNYQVSDGDSEVRNNVPPSSNELGFDESDGSAKDPSAFRQHILKHHDMMARIWMNDPELAEIILNDESKYSDEWLQWFLRIRHCQRAEWKRQLQNNEWALLDADEPHHGIIKSWDYKLQDIFCYRKPDQKRPRVSAYINGKKVEVLIDTGAAISTITRACAVICGLLELINENDNEPLLAMDGSEVLVKGRINITAVKIGDISCLCSFVAVVSDKGEDCILGMDFLASNKCVIDPDANVLRIPGSDPVPFIDSIW